MKMTKLLYSIGIIVVFGIVIGFVSSTFPTLTPTQQGITEWNTPSEPKTTPQGTDRIATVQKLEGCGCCAERRARLKKHRRLARTRKLTEEKVIKTVSR